MDPIQLVLICIFTFSFGYLLGTDCRSKVAVFIVTISLLAAMFYTIFTT